MAASAPAMEGWRVIHALPNKCKSETFVRKPVIRQGGGWLLMTAAAEMQSEKMILRSGYNV